ncbi:hypothetical protein AArcCO_1941 [Halalkaliarchaeum sp. AArc-CO]|uniref:hypothetical protein n=1 Tax=unclassified Halalkaliarchaeum TaxID=2678344 RepID=UPI00217EB0EC|nr:MULTISPECIES: hypothetical protein [unclassified Halalkaliarchaeum]MDR5671742.1 hypothetical protein [Halalkaliarchaeum sp. AArc-GB]UWG51238.1 hypothetical protein AArcCO_1941 [Halalkaliarchaeum sp. AArc-CO]
MASQTIDVDGGGISGTIAQYRSQIAAVLTVVVVAVVLFALDAIAVPLETGETLRVAGSAAIAGGDSVYNQYAGLWLAVRATMGAYIVFVAVFISVLAFATWKEVLE